MDKLQRLLLINQFEILSKIDDVNRSDCERKIKILKEGYEIHYTEYFWAGLSGPLSKEDSQFVLDVLTMYRDLKNSVSSFDTNDKHKIKSYDTNFKGFDCNDPKEVKLAYYAEFVIKDLGKYQGLIENVETEDFNSHEEMKDTYQRYLKNYKEVKADKPNKFEKLSVEDLNKIFAY